MKIFKCSDMVLLQTTKNKWFGYTFIKDVNYLEYVQPLNKDLPFLPENSM